jgi:hypothetical protein
MLSVPIALYVMTIDMNSVAKEQVAALVAAKVHSSGGNYATSLFLDGTRSIIGGYVAAPPLASRLA